MRTLSLLIRHAAILTLTTATSWTLSAQQIQSHSAESWKSPQQRSHIRQAHLPFNNGPEAIGESPWKPQSASHVVHAAHQNSPTQIPMDLDSMARTGYIQYIRFHPTGATVELASSQGVINLSGGNTVGIMVGVPYRMRINNVFVRGTPVTTYPTIRLISYLAPPRHVNPADHPVPIKLGTLDFEDAKAGMLVSNVVYVEPAQTATPIAFPRGELPVINTSPGIDPLETSRSLGRPIMIIEMGNRIPVGQEFNGMQPGDGPVFWPSETRLTAVTSRQLIQATHWNTQYNSSPCSSCATTGAPCPPMHSIAPAPATAPDEFICDGGDEMPPAHFTSQDAIGGLEAGAAAVKYRRASEERLRLATANKICVYGPRFGIVRSAWGVTRTTGIDIASKVNRSIRRAGLETQAGPGLQAGTQNLKTQRRQTRLGNILVTDLAGAMQETKVITMGTQHITIDKTRGRELAVLSENRQELRLARSIEAALTWTKIEFPQYSAIGQAGNQIKGRVISGELREIETPPQTPGELILWKTTEACEAHSGDEIEFLIHYKNMGQETVESVSIIDNLVARLEYAPDSAQSDHKAVFTAEQNDVDSLELRWDILDPIKGGEEGVVWFRAKVR